MAEEKTFDANPVMAKMREQFGMQMQSIAFLQVDFENLLKENENLKSKISDLNDVIEKQNKLIEEYENAAK